MDLNINENKQFLHQVSACLKDTRFESLVSDVLEKGVDEYLAKTKPINQETVNDTEIDAIAHEDYENTNRM